MDQFTRRIVGVGVHRGAVDGVGLCRKFNRATRGHTPPKYLSADHDPLYGDHQWQANLRILDVEEIKTVPYAPLSHPFLEGRTPEPDTEAGAAASVRSYRWQSHCRGLYQTPMAA